MLGSTSWVSLKDKAFIEYILSHVAIYNLGEFSLLVVGFFPQQLHFTVDKGICFKRMDNPWPIINLSSLHSGNYFKFPLRFPWVFFLSSFFYSAFSEGKDRQINAREFSWFSAGHCHTSEKKSCASEFVRNSTLDAGHNWASTYGEGCAERGHTAPFHACLPRLHCLCLLHPWAFSSFTQWANGYVSDQPMKGGPIMNHYNAVSWFSTDSMLLLSHFCHFSMLLLSLLSS